MFHIFPVSLSTVPINPIIRSRIRISLLCLQFFVYDLTVYGIVFSKTRKLQYINRVNLSDLHCSSCGYIRHIFPVFYRFHKINSNSHNNIMALKLGISIIYFSISRELLYFREIITFPEKEPCLLGHSVWLGYAMVKFYN